MKQTNLILCRGWSHQAVCCVLVVWLCKEMNRVQWRTVQIRDGAFLFNAAPIEWILCHAIYRFILITLPCFETMRYVGMEPASLGVMLLMSYAYGAPNDDVTVWFGFSDTLVASTFSFTSFTANLYFNVPPMNVSNSREMDSLVFLHIIIGGFALGRAIS